mmetsp:Transcript_76545/g.247729  ORF Transcript_76545/g.247729 Transcript_76545/m.247729 type:complete len:80 (+) Transcript_76545:702-941(+)
MGTTVRKIQFEALLQHVLTPMAEGAFVTTTEQLSGAARASHRAKADTESVRKAIRAGRCRAATDPESLCESVHTVAKSA